MARFQPATRGWFEERFDGPSDAQVQSWPAIFEGTHTLLAAPTGSGQTLAAFLCAIDSLVAAALDDSLEDHTYVVYISPLKALGNDVEKNLQEPLVGILERAGLPPGTIRTAVRSGDTPAHERRKQLTKPAHVFVTTPESLYILLTSKHGRTMLSTARTVIVDEIHAMVGDKRGVHLALTLERLQDLCGARVQRIGLSATQRPIDTVAHFLVGTQGAAEPSVEAACKVVDAGHRRAMDLVVEVPPSPLSAVMSSEVWTEVHRRLADLVAEHTTTLIFVNTRRLAERLTAHLEELIGEGLVMSHHGSLSRKHRHLAEQRLKNGELKALVATASLELGIDIGDVDLVCQIGSTRTIASLLQRVGRSGHTLGLIPKGRVFPLTRDQLVECAALMHAIQTDVLDVTHVVDAPLDILAQQIVASVASRDFGEDELFALVRRAWPYRALERSRFDDVVAMLADGFSTRRGRRGAYIHHDAVNGQLRARRGAGITAMTSGGAIPDIANYDVRLQSTGTRIGSLDEDFAIECMVGDVFRLGNNAWQIQKVETGRVIVTSAAGMPPTIPFWLGEAPTRSAELSKGVSDVRGGVMAAAQAGGPGSATAGGVLGAVAWLESECGLTRPAAQQAADYLVASANALGAMPTQQCVVMERFFDESGGMQLIIHSTFGARLNRAWGLALRKRFCRRFNFELQAAATEDAIVLSLGVTHSFDLDEVFDYLSPESVRYVLVQALLDAPVFETRWRWNANRSLAIPRFRNGKRVPAALQRMNAEDLISVVFPDQIACLENIPGERQVPEHPLVDQTIEDCLVEAMDLAGLQGLLVDIESGAIDRRAVDLTEPSPLSAEILNAAPYAFLDDAPLEERRTNAVRGRRWVDPNDAAALGTLDAAAADAVRESAWPLVRDADELHDALVVSGSIASELDDVADWHVHFDALEGQGRAVAWTSASGTALWFATERLSDARVAHGDASIGADLVIPSRYAREVEYGVAVVELVRGRLEIGGPMSSSHIATRLGLALEPVEHALRALQGEGFAMRGQYLDAEMLWCERRLLARMHRMTLDRLRSHIEPVEPTAYVRFLLDHQRVTDQAEGVEGLMAVLAQLQGYGAPASAWEEHILPQRVRDYAPSMLDLLCLSGRVAWMRSPRGSGGAGPVKTTPIMIGPRESIALWAGAEPRDPSKLTRDGRRVFDALDSKGALFFDELVRASGGLAAQTTAGLSELVAGGFAVSDGFAGLRSLLVPAAQRDRGRGGRGGSRGGRSSARGGLGSMSGGAGPAGRWSLAPLPSADAIADELSALYGIEPGSVERVETLLDRHGVLFRSVLEREDGAPPWRDVLRVLRRMEARGDVRGGRFVSTFSGEQYARPDVVSLLRKCRSAQENPSVVSLSAVDPAAVIGHILRDTAVSAIAGNRVLLRGGEVVAVLQSGDVRWVTEQPVERRWELEQKLVRIESTLGPRRHR